MLGSCDFSYFFFIPSLTVLIRGSPGERCGWKRKWEERKGGSNITGWVGVLGQQLHSSTHGKLTTSICGLEGVPTSTGGTFYLAPLRPFNAGGCNFIRFNSAGYVCIISRSIFESELNGLDKLFNHPNKIHLSFPVVECYIYLLFMVFYK